MKRFVIHILGSDRHSSMVTEMTKQYGADWEVYPAIVNNSDPKKGLSDTFKKIIEENYNEPFIHILEDDVMFTNKEGSLYFDMVKSIIPNEWDIFSGCSYTHTVEKEIEHSFERTGYNIQTHAKKISDWRSMINCVIKKSSYDYILAHNDGTDIDYFLSRQPLNVYLCWPMVCKQRNGYSYLKKKTVDYDHHLTDKALL